MTDKKQLIDRLRFSAKVQKMVSLLPHESGAVVALVQDLKEQIAVCKAHEDVAWRQTDELIRITFRQRQQIVELQKYVPAEKHVLDADSV